MQAAVVLTDTIRHQDAHRIRKFTTPIGFQQITRDMLLSRSDTRLKLVRFNTEHLRRAIPMKVTTKRNYGKKKNMLIMLETFSVISNPLITGRKYCFIDMLFVGLRNTKDFDSPDEAVEINEILRKLDADLKTPFEVMSVPHRIVFAEIFIRFRRDYTQVNAQNNMSAARTNQMENDKDWSVSFYKILTFDVLNYDPKQ